ncbi:MAG TPA: alpha/beta fold hydrolase [Gaiellaceae bacterium]|nr:alpha/beta fold hydrolase [Gaiellaceae bacterium]
MPTVEVDGLRIAYERAGEGPPVVFLHGYVGDGLRTWRRQLEALSDEHTVVAWDAPGAGGSSNPPGTFGLGGYADVLAGFPPRAPAPADPRGRALVRRDRFTDELRAFLRSPDDAPC